MSSKEPEELPFVPSEGVPIAPNPVRDQRTRILETMIDLQMAIAGCVALQGTYPQGETTKALARACSLFIRKLVLGDRGDRRTRLLNDGICEAANLLFNRVRKISVDRRTLTISRELFFAMQLTKIDEPDAGKTYASKPSRQQLVFTIHWPLTGMAEWLNEPTDDDPWMIQPKNLFDMASTPTLDCDDWLGQQLVIFNGRGISLRKMLEVTVNTEGAHSPPMDRLLKPAGQPDVRDKMIADSDAYILSNLLVAGVQYNHAIVIETALYLYTQLIENEFFERPAGGLYIPSVCLVPTDVFSPNQKWLEFAGGLIIAHRGQRRSYNIRAPR